jgi:hypothetical protein
MDGQNRHMLRRNKSVARPAPEIGAPKIHLGHITFVKNH